MKKVGKTVVNGKQAQVYLAENGKHHIAIQDEIDKTFGVIAYKGDDNTHEWVLWGPACMANHAAFLNHIAGNAVWTE